MLFLLLLISGLWLIVTGKQLVKTEILALHLGPHDKCPFGKHDGFVRVVAVFIHGFQAQRIAAYDVPAENETDGFLTLLADLFAANGLIFGVPNVIKAVSTGDHVIHQQVHTVDTCYSNNRLFLKFERQRFFLSRRNGAFLGCLQFSAKNLHNEITVSAGRFQKAAVHPFGFLLHQIQHGVDFPLTGEYLAVV